MKRKLLTIVLGVMMALMVTSASFAEFVYVTEQGKKYHNENSRFIKNKKTEKITLEEAQKRGLEPSSAYLKFKENETKAEKE